MNHLLSARMTPVLIISFLWAIVFTLQKKAVNLNGDIVLLAFLKIFLLGSIGLISLALYSSNNEVINEIKNLDNEIILIIGISCLFEFVSIFYYFKSIKNNDASWCIPLIESGTVLVTVLFSIYFLKEKLTFIRIIGILTILLGIFLVNQS